MFLTPFKDFDDPKKGDVYSFAIIVYEMFRRPCVDEGPYVDTNLSQKQILENIRYPNKNHFTNNRPHLEALKQHAEIEPSENTLSKIFLHNNIIFYCGTGNSRLSEFFNQQQIFLYIRCTHYS